MLHASCFMFRKLGQKRIITTNIGNSDKQDGNLVPAKRGSSNKKQIFKGVINVFSSYNNTLVSIADNNGNVFAYSSAGILGFKGTKKSTPYAATLVSKDAAEKAKKFGFREAKISVKGIGPGREAAIRGIASAGINITSIVDTTPIPHNGVRPPKPRRV